VENLILDSCIICRRPLSHPTSVELGIGPICAKRHSIERNKTGAENNAANVILARIMREGLTGASLDDLRELGFSNLADAVGKTLAGYTFETAENGDFSIAFSYDPAKIEVMRYLRRKVGARWDPQYKVWRFQDIDRHHVWQYMNDWYRPNGERVLCWGPVGVFFLGIEE
jgi:hypothetical protein